MTVNPLGDVCLRWDHQAQQCADTTPVGQVAGKRAAHFLAKMSVDVDGSPRAYHPSDKQHPDNAGKAFDWLTSVKLSDLNGIQGQDAVGPAPGFYVSATSLKDTSVADVKNASRYVDAGIVPYIVLPESSFPVPAGMTLLPGCLTFVVDRTTGRSSGAIFADVGNAVGEASLALAMRLGHRPFYSNLYPKVAGFDETEYDERFFFLVFPDKVVAPPWPESAIQKPAKDLFDAWGGEARLRDLYPGTHALLPPDDVALPPPMTDPALTS
jgi:Fungal chitosanase of glycosyl hydrolase group 75